MRLDDESESTNFEIRRGGGGLGGGGGIGLGLLGLIGSKFGIGGIIVVVLVMLVFGGNPLGLVGGGGGTPQTSTNQAELTDVQRLSLKVLGSTERRWTDLFARNGQRYQPTTLVFYDQSGMSGCGAAQSAMGPFYCPADNRIYLDTTFFDELRSRFGAPGDFAQAYVIAHEVGHHIQTLNGISDRVRAVQERGDPASGNAEQVKMELQADCFAGVWAANDHNLLEPGDVEEGLRAAEAIGDDTLQKAAGQRPVPESFTHGTSEQRMFWLKRGLDTGDPAACDTFSAHP
jgi:predicted metalloprotease